MKSIQWTIPLLLAGLIIAGAFGFVRFFNAYEEPGEHWAPGSPVVHENARFTTDMGAAGDYLVTVEKLTSKFPLFFVEYQPPGTIVTATLHSDDGSIRLDQRFADEGRYRITVQHTIHPEHRETIDFTVQTPLFKYANDLFLACLLLLAGFVSGHRLKQLSTAAAAILLVVMLSTPTSALAHGGHGTPPTPVSAQAGDWQLSWLHDAPHGPANRSPLDFSLRLSSKTAPPSHTPYRLEIIHSESHQPVLTIEGSTDDGTIPLHYSPPDGTDYQLYLSAVVNGNVQHFAVDASAEAIRPTLMRTVQSFVILMIPVLIGMAWGWRRAAPA